ncbi:MAG: hypothetical protein M3R27_08945 [Bacteroidota bacterium]|nr:hypothetical protein [Bacteroidota bacterium]
MSIEEKLIEAIKENTQEIKALRSDLKTNGSEYCTPEEACQILGVNNTRYLKQLVDMNVLERRKGTLLKYKKVQLYKVKASIDNCEIVLTPIK